VRAKNEGRLVCRICLTEGIINSQVIERVINPRHTGTILQERFA
jgi:hypothetical protein